jgi:hypothetical protein
MMPTFSSTSALPPRTFGSRIYAAQAPQPESLQSLAARTVARSGAASSRDVLSTPTSLVTGEAQASDLRAGTPIGSVSLATLQSWFDQAATYADRTYLGRNNLDGTLAWLETEVVESYLAAYQRTHDTKYLDKVIPHLDMELQLRDSAQGWKDYRGLSLPAWQCTKYNLNQQPAIWAVHTGLIAHGLAEFAALVKQTGASQYSDKANTYLQAAMSALAVHDDEYRSQGNAGYYIMRKGFPAPTDGVNIPSNMNLAMASALTAVYQASGQTAYLERATQIATTFRSHLTSTTAGGYDWNYTFGQGYSGWGPGVSTHTPSSSGNRTVEDSSHGALDVECVRQLHDANVVFSAADMQRFGYQLDHALLKTTTLPGFVDGTGVAPNQLKEVSWTCLAPWSGAVCQRSYDLLMGVPLQQGSVPVMALRGMAMLMQTK